MAKKSGPFAATTLEPKMASFLSHFKADRDFPDDRWSFVTEKPVLREFVAFYAPFDEDFHKYKLPRKPYPLEPSCPTCREQSSEVSVFIFEKDEAAEELQENAWRFIAANFEEVESELKQKLLAVHKRGIELIKAEIADGGPYGDHWAFIKSKIPEPSRSIECFFKLVGVSLASSGPDDHAYVGFEFQSAWDKDHGLQIIMHKDKVHCSAGMTELIFPGKDIEAAIRAIQSYELDACDRKL